MNTYILFTQEGKILGDYSEVTEELLADNRHCIITEEMRKYIVKHYPNILIDTDKIVDCHTVINSIDYFKLTEETIKIDSIKNKIIKNIKKACGVAITMAKEVILTSGDVKKFTYKLEDQINLSGLVTNYKSGDFISYHASGELNELYSYEDICIIYKTLLNSKLYNQIYTQVLCNWITNNYTEEMYKEGITIEYNFINETIQTEVDLQYNQQKL